MYIHNL